MIHPDALHARASMIAKPYAGTVEAPAKTLKKNRDFWSYSVIVDVIRGFIVIAAALSTTFALFVVGRMAGAPEDAIQRTLAIMPAFCIIVHLMLPIHSKSQLDTFTPRDAGILALVAGFSLVSATALHIAIGFRDFSHPEVYFGWFIAAFFGMAIARASGVVFLTRSSLNQRIHRKIAIYGVGPNARKIYEAVVAAEEGTRFAGFFDDRFKSSRLKSGGFEVCGGLDTLVAMTRRGDIDEIVIALPREAAKRISMISSRFEELSVDVHICTHFATDFPVAAERGPSVSHIGDVGLLELNRRPIRDWGTILKRLEDIVFGLVFLILLLPVMALTALAVRIESSGPVIFRQKRHGLMNETITVYKFRTMLPENAHSTLAQATRNDPRITRVGAFLRKTSLDELPQLINVIKGEMSLVGPRPHAIAHNNLYGSMIDRYYGRHRVRPGITGWAQVNGYRGETRDPQLMVKRVEFDLDYIENWSLWMDIKIIFLTPFRGLIHKNAY